MAGGLCRLVYTCTVWTSPVQSDKILSAGRTSRLVISQIAEVIVMKEFGLQIDADYYNQSDAIKETQELVAEFCRVNTIPEPLILESNRSARWVRFGFYKASNHAGRGDNWHGALYYNPRKCRKPVKTPGFAWTYTGYKADLTAPGVIAHEMGHHVWECQCRSTNGRHCKSLEAQLAAAWQNETQGEKPTTSYGATRVEEDFAESFKLFLLNPDLLDRGATLRHSFFVDQLKLQPVVHWTFDEVLALAHPRLIAAAARWAGCDMEAVR